MKPHRAGRFLPKPEPLHTSNLLDAKGHGDVLHLPEEEPKSVCSFCFSGIGCVTGKPRRAGGQAAACQQLGLQIGSGWVAPVRCFQALKAVKSGRLEQVAGQVVSPQ
jgi:hypothetical protein